MGTGTDVAIESAYPLFGILLSPVIGAAAMTLSSVSVISNALRLRRAQLGDGLMRESETWQLS
jgi:Cu+-exporting ATPase